MATKLRSWLISEVAFWISWFCSTKIISTIFFTMDDLSNTFTFQQDMTKHDQWKQEGTISETILCNSEGSLKSCTSRLLWLLVLVPSSARKKSTIPSQTPWAQEHQLQPPGALHQVVGMKLFFFSNREFCTSEQHCLLQYLWTFCRFFCHFLCF